MKKVYIIERGQSQSDGSVYWHSKQAFKSKKDMRHYIENSYEVNEGWDKMEVQDEYDKKEGLTFIHYKCLAIDKRQFTVLLKVSVLTIQHT
jgi:hypothetical protein|tara:strand:+ start:1164 stop:1436 length:273 start_codon:yes stop_codon:yes gene_type:complete